MILIKYGNRGQVGEGLEPSSRVLIQAGFDDIKLRDEVGKGKSFGRTTNFVDFTGNSDFYKYHL